MGNRAESRSNIQTGRWLTPEEYAEIIKEPLDYIRRLCSRNVKPNRCPKMIDERDLLILSNRRYKIRYRERDISGFGLPRIIER